MSDADTAVTLPAGDAAAKFEKRTQQYVELRDRIKEIQERQKDELAELLETQNLLTAWLMENIEKVGASSIKTKGGTVYTTTRYTASLQDPKAFMDYVIANKNWDLLDRKANATACRDFVAANGSEPPGAKLSALRTIGVRRATGK